MKGGAQTALAIGVGYVLGRRRKMRLATVLALGAATGGAGRFGPAAMRQGAKYLGKTDIAGKLGPQVTEIVDTVRGDLLQAAKGAAATAVTSRIDSLSDNLHDRAETLRDPQAVAGKAKQAADDTAGRVGRGLRGKRRTDEDSDEYEEPADEYEDEEDLDEAPADDADDAGELPEDEAESEAEAEPEPRRRRTTRSPVARARR